ncbi:MAG TPA: valine--tRNA ligase, partial [Bacteroidota bacterium]|nr:valine--tRNA ligase [Bacteroidota bacterium]
MPDTGQSPSPAKTYSPRDVESKWYAIWEQSGFFHAVANPERTPYTIVIPPPNVTGVLHMGHILNNTLQDVLIRYKRMTGFEACWIPGTDHAGIATQHVVERSLRKEGKTRHDIGREKFVQRVWEWKQEYGGVIVRQLRTLGASCDWAREKFTMDETLSNAVREVFVSLYEEGLIYRGKYIINWCPRDHTAISDDEVTYTEQQGKLYYIRYPLSGKEGESLTVATTRPETMFGDTAIAVHPDDERFTRFVGASARIPLAGREIPVIADESVDPAFGTGMVKVTPAHDPNDYLIGRRHALPEINIFDISAKLNDAVPAPYRGLDRYDARGCVLRDLEEAGLLAGTADHANRVGRCYRCDTVIEPYLSDQWFVRMKPLATPALEVVRNGTIRFYPERWTKVYEHWMTNIRDWCISRQLWWGHRIPVWYCTATEGRTDRCDEPLVSRTTPSACPHCKGTGLKQDEDVLDTWFSSWLWPFSVHDWPAQKSTGKEGDLRYFYPTDTLVTAPEIIFFWVARMIMAGLKFGPTFTGSTEVDRNVPFRDVYFTSIVRDARGRKMSKSLGNSPEPLELIAEYGADAVRFTMLALAPVGQDIIYAKEKNELGRNLANKIWNAGRFLMMNRDQTGEAMRVKEFTTDHSDLADRWILSRLHSTLRDVKESISLLEFNRVTRQLYDFFWHDYCDWYVEMMKSRLYGPEELPVKQAVLTRGLDVYDAALRLLHPIMPFVTEEMWQSIRPRAAGVTIMRESIPEPDGAFIDTAVEKQMAYVQSIIEAVRTIRGEMSIPPSREITLLVTAGEAHPAEEVRRYEGYMMRLARVSSLSIIEPGARPPLSATAVVEGEEIFVPLEGVIDLDLERSRLGKEIERVTGMLKGIGGKLANPDFTGKAPPEVVAREQEKQAAFEANLIKLTRSLRQLSGGEEHSR